MLKMLRLDTAIRIQKKKDPPTTNENGFPVDVWEDIIDEDIPCEWHNKYGAETVKAGTEKAREAASIRFWYLPGITPECRIVRVEDGAVFDVFNVDDYHNQHQVMELELQRYINR